VRRFLGAVLPASIVLSGLTMAATPSLPSDAVRPIGVIGREITISVDGQRTVALPFAASHVALHWPGARDARVSIAFAAAEGAFGPDIPVELDDVAEAPDANETYGFVLWADGARSARITSDRPLPRVSVLAMAQREGVAAAGGSVVEAAVGQHAVITRAGWGADESLRFDAGGHETWPPMFSPLQQFIIHHTAGRNHDPDPAATIRAIYYEHAIARGLGDIDYNYLIDEAGNIYEGRRARAYAPGEIPTSEDAAGNVVRATHAAGFNPGSLGIVLLGTLTSRDATPAARAALTWLLSWAAERHGIDPTASHLYINTETGTETTLPRIAGHRDVNETACPGTVFYRSLPALRAAIARRIAAGTGSDADHIAPRVATFAPLGPPSTGAASLHFGLTFSEPVSDLRPSDLALSGTSRGWTVTGVFGSAAAYTVTVSAGAPTPGSVILTLAAASVVDRAAHLGPAKPAIATVQWAPDREAPSVVLFATPGTSPTSATTILVTVTFSEPVAPFPSSAISLGGTSHAATPWSIGLVYGSGASYMFKVSLPSPATGTLTFGLPVGATEDLAMNANLASSTVSVVFDATAPTTTAPVTDLRPALTGASTWPVRVSWTGHDVGGSGLADYDLARSVDGRALSVIAGGLLTTAVDLALPMGHRYRFAVRARDRAGNLGAWAAGPTFGPRGIPDRRAMIRYL